MEGAKEKNKNGNAKKVFTKKNVRKKVVKHTTGIEEEINKRNRKSNKEIEEKEGGRGWDGKLDGDLVIL